MILVSESANAVGCLSGSWSFWSLSDGYVDLPAHLLREPDDGVHRPINQLGSTLRLIAPKSLQSKLTRRNGGPAGYEPCLRFHKPVFAVGTAPIIRSSAQR